MEGERESGGIWSREEIRRFRGKSNYWAGRWLLSDEAYQEAGFIAADGSFKVYYHQSKEPLFNPAKTSTVKMMRPGKSWSFLHQAPANHDMVKLAAQGLSADPGQDPSYFQGPVWTP